MFLTKQRSSRNPDDFPTVQLFLLAIVRLAEPIALTSIFPYAWALIKRFKIGNEQDASFYAGLLISSFSLAEAMMGMYWGSLSDRVGRKPVLLLGCLGTMLSMIIVGFATNIWVALAGRAVGGFLNGNIAVIQTMVSEMVTRPEHEPKAYSVMPFVWSLGTILGPSIGGVFADPHASWPNLFVKGSLLYRFPFLLPNLICAALLLVSICLGYFMLEETHPDMQPRVVPAAKIYSSEETPLLETSDALKQPAVDLRSRTYGTIRSKTSVGLSRDASWPEDPEKSGHLTIFSKRILALVVALSIFTYHSMTYDHLLPIFFEDYKVQVNHFSGPSLVSLNPLYSPGGLGLSTMQVGCILAVQGLIALFIQAVVFPFAAGRLGVYKLFIVVTILHPIAYLVMPVLPHVTESLLFPAIYTCLTIRNVLSIIIYPLLLILIKEATPCLTILGKVNGFAASAGAACRMIAPPVAGYLYTIGSQMDCTSLAWYGSALVAGIGAIQCFWVTRARNEDVSRESGGPKRLSRSETTTRVVEEDHTYRNGGLSR